jgi:hypothetical protein
VGVQTTLFREDSRDHRAWPPADSGIGIGARAKPGPAVRSKTAENEEPAIGRHDRRGQVSADPFYTYGPPELCCWKVAPATFWFQTTDPRYSRKLNQRQDTRRVAVTGVNHYRRTYEMRGNWRKVKGIVNRYRMRTSDTFSGAVLRQGALEIAPRVKIAVRQKDAAFAKLREICT